MGDHVVAIGSPLGLEGTVSDGIVSAFRDVAKIKWIQTTAPASHGNSGGPLLDLSDKVVGVITMGVNPELGQNLNFAAPCSEVKELLVAASQQAKPLDSVAAKGESTFTDGTVWTSITNGRDYDTRQDSDYLYIDWASIPPDVKTQGGFERAELRKGTDGKWRGKFHQSLPCTYDAAGWRQPPQIVTKWCSRDADVEIDFMSDSRIEGAVTSASKFDCYSCEAKGRMELNRFTWIRK